MSRPVAIDVSHLGKTYDKVRAVEDLSFQVYTGEIFGLLGPNGAGKSTTLRILITLLNPTSGSARIFGLDSVTDADRVRQTIGYVPQERAIDRFLTGREHLELLADLYHLSPEVAATRIPQLLKLVELEQQADRPAKTYSGGMKRRIGIGQALLGYPKLLIVDEPTAGLDPEERVRFRNLLADMAGRCTVILSTHVIEDISHSCNDLAIIREGRVLFRGQPGELIGLARGRVWSILTSGERPTGDLKVVSTLQLQNGVQYRVIGMPDEQYQAQAVEPSLEDGYMLAMGEKP